MRAKKMRPVALRNEDGSESTHLMMSFEEDGVFKVAPTLFPREGFETNLNSDTWKELSPDEAIEEARKRGEVFTFATEEEANDFAEGGWKTVSTVDVEAESFFNERGKNYHAFQQARQRYDALLDEKEFLEEANSEGVGYDDLTEKEKELYGKYFDEDGRIDNSQAEIAIQEKRMDADALVDIIGDDELLTVEEDLDVYLEGERQQKAQKAAKMNQAALAAAEVINEESVRVLGVGIPELANFVPKTSREQEVYNNIVGEVLDVLKTKEDAAVQYELSNLYMNAKHNKNVQKEFVENLEGFNSELSNGLATGNAAEILLQMSPVGQALGGFGIDMDDDAAVAKAVADMIAIEEGKDGRLARGLTRFNNARTNAEMYRALRNDPAEVSMQWMGASLAQMLPYGSKILAGTAATGAATGAVVGSTALGAGAVPGAVAGLGYGIRTGMAINSFVLEYTSAVLEAVSSQGYDPTDPDSFAKALNDPKVWEEGKVRGGTRGLVIGAMDYVSGGLAGKVFKPARAATRMAKAGTFVAERAVYDPLAEGAGEALAMLSVGDELELKEIIAEAGGALGNQSTNASMNIIKATMGNNNQRLANELMDLGVMASDNSTDKQIQRWTDNMTRLGKITPEQGQRILENMSLRREANDLLSVASPTGVLRGVANNKSAQRERLMELMEVRDGLSSTEQRKKVFGNKIAAINEEIREISETGKLVADPVDTSKLNPIKRKGVATYKVGRNYMTKDEFIGYVESAGPTALERLRRKGEVKNDPETAMLLASRLSPQDDAETIIQETDAIQEPSTEEVPTREPSGDSAAVGEGLSESGEAAQPIAAEDQVAEETIEEEAQVEAIDRPVRSDVTAFRNGTIDPQRLDGIVAGIEARQAAGKKLTKFQQEVLAADETAVASEAEQLSQELAAEEVGVETPTPVAEEAVAQEEAAPTERLTDDEMTLELNRYEREAAELKSKFKKERAKIKRRKNSPAKTAALAALNKQEAAEVEEIKSKRRIVQAAKSVRQGKGLPKFARPDGKFPATEEQLRQINELAGVEEAAPVVEETAAQEEIALTDPLAELYFNWIRSLRSAEITAIQEKEASSRTRSERAKLAAVTRKQTKAEKAAEERGLSTVEQVGLLQRVNSVVLSENESAASEDTVEEAAPEAVSETRAAIVELGTTEYGEQTPMQLETKIKKLAELIKKARQENDTETAKLGRIVRKEYKAQQKIAERKARAAIRNADNRRRREEAAPAVEAAPVVEEAVAEEVEQTSTEIEAELLASRQEGNTAEEIAAEEFPLQESDFATQEAYGRAIKKWSAGKARRLAAAEEQQTQLSPEERAAADKQQLMAPIRAGKFAAFGTRNGQESYTQGFDGSILDRERGREPYNEFKERVIDGKYYYTQYEGGRGVVSDVGDRAGYVATTFVSNTKLSAAQKALIKTELLNRNKELIRNLDSDTKKMPDGFSTSESFGRYDNVQTRQFMLDTKTDGMGMSNRQVAEATELMDEVSPELAENDYTVDSPTMETTPIVVTENESLVAKVKRVALSALKGKSINLAMADQLKVDDSRMGGPLFPMQEGIFGKVAWASIDENAARAIIVGAAKGDFTAVYNMKPSALDSNMVTMRYAMELISQQENSQEIYEQAIEYLKGRKYGTNPSDNKKAQAAFEAATVEEFLDKMDELGTDLRAAILTNLFPTNQVESKVDIHMSLKEIGATIENIRAANIEQFAADLPMGALTTLLEVTDADGNKVTEEALGKGARNWKNFMMTKEQQAAEGVPSHDNYPIYIRGRAVGVMEDTVPFWNVLPDALAMIDSKIAKKTKQRDKYTVIDKNGKTIDVRTQINPDGSTTVTLYNKQGQPKAGSDVTTNVKNIRAFIKRKYGEIQDVKKGRPLTSSEAFSGAMRSAMMTAGTAATVEAPAVSKYQQFISRLSASFPSVEVVTSQEQFDALMKDAYSKKLTTKDQKVYGVVADGKVYLNPSLENYNTPIHEFGHIWLNTAKELNPEAYAAGIRLVEGSQYESQVRENKEYKRVIKEMRRTGATEAEIDAYVREEALALAIGNKGESFATAAQKRNFSAWLTDLFNFIKKLTGISDMSSEQLQNLDIEGFAQAVVVDLLSENQQFSQAQEVGLSNEMQFMTGTDNQSMSMRDTIDMGRAKGYSDAAIKKLLIDRGYKATEVNEAMAEQYDKTTQVPTEFGNVEGGMAVGKQMFEDVKNKVAAFAKSKAAPTNGQVREKAMELLKANPVFQSQSVAVQEELISAFDKTLGTSANRSISQQVAALRNNIRQRRKGAQTLQEAKRELSKFIKANMPKSGIYSQAQINRLVNRVAKATESSLLADMEYVLAQVAIQNEKIKGKLINKLVAQVKKDARKGRSSIGSNKVRRGSIGADAQAFAAELSKVLAAATIKNPAKRQAALDAIRATLETEEAAKAIAKNIQQGFDSLTSKERRVVLKAMAFQEFQGIQDMTLEEVQAITEGYAVEQMMERTILKQTQKERSEKNAEINEGVTAQLKQLFPEFFNTDGSPLNENEINAKAKEARRLWRSGKGQGASARFKGMVAGAKVYVDTFRNNNTGDVIKSVLRGLYHLGTFMNTLGPEMKKQVYDRLNKAESRYLKAYFSETAKLDSLAKQFGFKDYETLRREVYSKESIELEVGKIGKEGPTSVRKEKFDLDKVMRLYALSKNPIQRDKLRRMGMDFDDPAFAAQIEGYLGADLMAFSDAVVDYLSNEYYETVNNVYRETNDVNLNYISNYFPTRTITKTDTKLLEDGDFQAIFDAEFATGLKNRLDVDSEIDLEGASFTTALEDHFQSMERFKAYSADTRTLNSIMNNEAVKTVLKITGMTSMVRQSINQAINPNSGKGAIYTDKALNWMQTAYTGVALAFKAVQVIKQATSAVQAIPDYTYRKDGKRMPVIDIMLWMADYAAVMAQPRKYMRLAEKSSPQFKQRLKLGIKGDIVGLEGGARRIPTIRKQGFRGNVQRAYQKMAGLATVVGDIAGVLGYMANYRRDIINGMEPDVAIEKFEEYNATQQSRRAADRSVIQQNQDAFTRMFTMFGSASLLMINNVVQSGTNIARDAGKGKAPKLKDVRKFYINYGVANALFVGASNFGKLWAGDDDDREEVMKKMAIAMTGLNLLSFVPLLGSTAEGVASYMMGDGFRPGEQGVNPLSNVFRNFRKVETGGDAAIATLKTAADLALKANTNVGIGVYNFVNEQIDDPTLAVQDMESFYESIGVTPSYQPSKFKDGELSEYGKRLEAEKERKKERRESRETPARKARKEAKKAREDARKFKRLPKNKR